MAEEKSYFVRALDLTVGAGVQRISVVSKVIELMVQFHGDEGIDRLEESGIRGENIVLAYNHGNDDKRKFASSVEDINQLFDNLKNPSFAEKILKSEPGKQNLRYAEDLARAIAKNALNR